MKTLSEASLYIHIPFCRKKCSYCHFYVIPDDAQRQQFLFNALLKEWEVWRPYFKDKQLISLYFGGGTPILLKQEFLESLISTILRDVDYSPEIEITLEANPEEVTYARGKELASAGINRISIGVQTHDDKLLQLLGRQHRGNKALDSIKIIADAGIQNISVDAMYDLPDQNFALWERTLQEIVKLPVTHISLYNLTIEPQTVFYKQRKELTLRLPPEEESVKMYTFAREFLEGNQFKQYEISAFAKAGCQAIHNSGYWTGRPFIGLGPSAFSYWDESRFQNISHLDKYIKALEKGESPLSFQEKLSDEARLREYIAVRLRLLQGFELPTSLPFSLEKDLRTVENNGWIERKGNHIRLTDQGILFYDSAATEIVL